MPTEECSSSSPCYLTCFVWDLWLQMGGWPRHHINCIWSGVPHPTFSPSQVQYCIRVLSPCRWCAFNLWITRAMYLILSLSSDGRQELRTNALIHHHCVLKMRQGFSWNPRLPALALHKLPSWPHILNSQFVPVETWLAATTTTRTILLLRWSYFWGRREYRGKGTRLFGSWPCPQTSLCLFTSLPFCSFLEILLFLFSFWEMLLFYFCTELVDVPAIS